jgi:hypothetical protein
MLRNSFLPFLSPLSYSHSLTKTVSRIIPSLSSILTIFFGPHTILPPYKLEIPIREPDIYQIYRGGRSANEFR